MARIELRDGQWAVLRDRLTHGQDKAIRRARAAGKTDDAALIEATTLLVRTFVIDWSVKDPDGVPIAITDEDAVDRAPGDIVDLLFEVAVIAWTKATVPNLPTPPSSAD